MRLASIVRRARFSVLFAVCVLATGGCVVAQEHTYDSAYAHYIIRKRGSIVEMRHLRKEAEWLESAVDLDDPLKPVVAYTSSVFSGVFFKDQPKKVLMVGLGGGGFNHLFNATFPEALLQTVEIDPLALELAKKHMAFQESETNKVAILDGRQFVKKTRERWDWVILDAFHAGTVPFHLKTSEFYAEIRKRLADDGILLLNLHSGTALYSADIKTLQKSFPQLMVFRVRDRGNVIAVAANYETPRLADQLSRYDVNKASQVLRKYVNLKSVREGADTDIDGETSSTAQVLSDDYCPAEYLNATQE